MKFSVPFFVLVLCQAVAFAQLPLQELNSRADKVIQLREKSLQLNKLSLADQTPYVRASVNDEALDFLALSKTPKVAELEEGARKAAYALNGIWSEVQADPKNQQLEKDLWKSARPGQLIGAERREATRQKLRQDYLEQFTIPREPRLVVRIWILQTAVAETLRYCQQPGDCRELRDLQYNIAAFLQHVR